MILLSIIFLCATALLAGSHWALDLPADALVAGCLAAMTLPFDCAQGKPAAGEAEGWTSDQKFKHYIKELLIFNSPAVANTLQKSIVRVETIKGTSTSPIFAEENDYFWALSERHCIGSASGQEGQSPEVKIFTYDNQCLNATVFPCEKGQNEDFRVILLRIEKRGLSAGTKLEALTLTNKILHDHSSVFMLGYFPFVRVSAGRQERDMRLCAIEGRTVGRHTAIPTVSPGFSGGPCLTPDAELIGINQMKTPALIYLSDNSSRQIAVEEKTGIIDTDQIEESLRRSGFARLIDLSCETGIRHSLWAHLHNDWYTLMAIARAAYCRRVQCAFASEGDLPAPVVLPAAPAAPSCNIDLDRKLEGEGAAAMVAGKDDLLSLQVYTTVRGLFGSSTAEVAGVEPVTRDTGLYKCKRLEEGRYCVVVSSLKEMVDAVNDLVVRQGRPLSELVIISHGWNAKIWFNSRQRLSLRHLSRCAQCRLLLQKLGSFLAQNPEIEIRVCGAGRRDKGKRFIKFLAELILGQKAGKIVFYEGPCGLKHVEAKCAYLYNNSNFTFLRPEPLKQSEPLIKIKEALFFVFRYVVLFWNLMVKGIKMLMKAVERNLASLILPIFFTALYSLLGAWYFSGYMTQMILGSAEWLTVLMLMPLWLIAGIAGGILALSLVSFFVFAIALSIRRVIREGVMTVRERWPCVNKDAYQEGSPQPPQGSSGITRAAPLDSARGKPLLLFGLAVLGLWGLAAILSGTAPLTGHEIALTGHVGLGAMAACCAMTVPALSGSEGNGSTGSPLGPAEGMALPAAVRISPFDPQDPPQMVKDVLEKAQRDPCSIARNHIFLRPSSICFQARLGDIPEAVGIAVLNQVEDFIDINPAGNSWNRALQPKLSFTIGVKPEYWTRGVGAALYDAVMRYATENQYRLVGYFMRCGDEGYSLLRFLERRGFTTAMLPSFSCDDGSYRPGAVCWKELGSVASALLFGLAALWLWFDAGLVSLPLFCCALALSRSSGHSTGEGEGMALEAERKTFSPPAIRPRLLKSRTAAAKIAEIDRSFIEKGCVDEFCAYGLVRAVSAREHILEDIITPSPEKTLWVDSSFAGNVFMWEMRCLRIAIAYSRKLTLRAKRNAMRFVSDNAKASFSINMQKEWDKLRPVVIQIAHMNLPARFEEALKTVSESGAIRLDIEWEAIIAGEHSIVTAFYMRRVRAIAALRKMRMLYHLHYHPTGEELDYSPGDLRASYQDKTPWAEIRGKGPLEARMRSAIFYTPVIFARVRRQIFRDVPQFNALFLRDFYSRNAEQFPLWLAILGVFGIKRRHLAYPLLAAARKRAAKYSDRQALLKGIEHAAEYRHDISYLRRQEMSRKENVGLLDVFDQIAQLGYCFSAPEFLVKRMRNVDFREGVTDKITAFILFVRAIKIISSKRDRVIPDAAPAFFVARETRLLEDMLKPVLMEAQDSLAHLFFHIHHNIPLDTELKPLVRSYNKLRNILLGWYEHELRRAARQKNRAKGVLLRAMVAWYSDSLTSWIDRFWWSEQMHEEKKADEKKLEAMEKAISRIRTFLLAAKLLKEVRLYLDRNHVNMYSPHSRFADNTDAGAYLTEFPFVLHSFNQHIPAVCKPRAGGVFPGRKIGINQGRINQDKSGTATIIFRTGTGKTKSRRAGVRWDK